MGVSRDLWQMAPPSVSYWWRLLRASSRSFPRPRQVGHAIETKTEGFVISQPVYLLFMMHTQRRIENDRFLTTAFNAETYTRKGFDHIAENTFKSVLLRHFPDLDAEKIPENAFFGWTK